MPSISKESIHETPVALKFSVFTKAEIQRLAVLQITTPITLDALGHPTIGGLYDSRLGPSTDRRAPCGTCGETFDCPGHFGYIDLGVPCVNPLFHKIVGTLLKHSCLICYKYQLPNERRTRVKEIAQQRDLDVDQVYGAVMEYILAEVKTDGKCIFCKNKIDRIQIFKDRILTVVRNPSRNPDKSAELDINNTKSAYSRYINAGDSKKSLQSIWMNDSDILELIVPVLKSVNCEFPTDIFFLEIVAVPPPNVRPLNFVAGRVLEHYQNTRYKNILISSITVSQLLRVAKENGNIDVLTSDAAKQYYQTARGNTALEKLDYAWDELQKHINLLLSSDSRQEGIGMKQVLEKKEGIIRQNMMGKRVNFAARSVITPDPHLDIDEVGIPIEFAKKLTYPVPVTPWNVENLRKLIRNGPLVYPGAVLVEMENGAIQKINPDSVIQQQSFLKTLLTPSIENGFQGVKIVHRHLQNGDIVLLNRQPTLHKPSIMAHRARVLQEEKTLRLHYANCKAYNADFDGDEMNLHFPQDEVAKSEGYNIAEVSQQYLVPKDGTPLSGLIQDHIIAGVRLSLRGRFFNLMDYQYLVFQGLPYQTDRIVVLPPAILKPTILYSGKQVLSTIILNIIPKGKEAINLISTSKVPARAWQREAAREWKAGGTPLKNSIDMTEAEVIMRKGELLCGILDKSHYGATPYSLIHCIYELYGGRCAIKLLSAFSKLFTNYLQYYGFTLGVQDILTDPVADKKRQEIIKRSRNIGREAVTKALDIPYDTDINEIVEKLEENRAKNPKFRQILDHSYKTILDSYTNEINKCCLPAGLISKFPENNLQLMVESGAKGTTVNTMQISCLLGQIELEGKRPPLMISGKSLPCFPVEEFAPRAGGFVDGRFMTGIQPEEFFFHCMAGREGLIDTAVKTSRSGYLQRCLIKHLEGLHVAYDLTVRNSDQRVVQFLYGEDGMDIFKTRFFNTKQLQFLQDNAKSIIGQNGSILNQLQNDENQALLKAYKGTRLEWINEHGESACVQKRRSSPFLEFCKMTNDSSSKKLSTRKLIKRWRKADENLKDQLRTMCSRCPDPINSKFQPDHHFGSLSEYLEQLMRNFTKNQDSKAKKEFENMFKLKAMQGLCNPGEPVGLLAAQSIGEPSTQMTLNTFHFAGRGDMNVTLGIPRLREILMMASKNIKTPSMEIPFKNVPNLEAKAAKLKKRLMRVVLSDVLEKIDVSFYLQIQPNRQYRYTLKFHCLPDEFYQDIYLTSTKSIFKHIRNKFFRDMFAAIAKVSRMRSNFVSMDKISNKTTNKYDDDNDNDDNLNNTTTKNDKKKQSYNNDASSSEDEIEDEEDAKQQKKFEDRQEDQEADDGEDVESGADEYDEIENGKPNLDSDGEKVDKSVVQNYDFANEYSESVSSHCCQLIFSLPVTFKKIDLSNLLKETANKSVIWEVPGIKRAITYVKDGVHVLKTEGINMEEILKYHPILDLNRLYTNDIHKMAETYGIEAALKIIVKEVKDVFNVYGIKVDPRHLSLIADYMTMNGKYEPLNRKGMETTSSPLQQISFESALAFLKQAIIKGKKDELTNPSSCLMIGKLCPIGTGILGLTQKLPAIDSEKRHKKKY